jgi:hypothetical protein
LSSRLAVAPALRQRTPDDVDRPTTTASSTKEWDLQLQLILATSLIYQRP